MNTRQVEVFRAVMLTGSVTGAARLLKVSQPAVSRILHRTEDALGFALFVRRGGRLLPTPEAEALHGEADSAVRGLQRVTDLANALSRGDDGILRIAANPSFGAEVLPRIVAGFRERHPHTRLEIMTTSHPAVVDRVALRQSDIGITQFASSHPALRAERLATCACRVAIPPGSPLSKLTEIPVSALDQLQLISYEPDTPIGEVVAGYLLANGIRLKPHITVRYPLIACMFVDAGLGGAILDPFVALSGERRWRFAIRPLLPALTTETWLLTRAAQPLSHAGRDFARMASAILRTIGRG